MEQKKLLICDDDYGIVNMLELMLEDLDAKVISETNSAKVCEKLIDEQPDILIVDLWMPVVTGDEIIKFIRRHDSIKHMFILCISASRNGEEVAMGAGADVFLGKPFDMGDLLDVVQQAIVRTTN